MKTPEGRAYRMRWRTKILTPEVCAKSDFPKNFVYPRLSHKHSASLCNEDGKDDKNFIVPTTKKKKKVTTLLESGFFYLFISNVQWNFCASKGWG